MRGCAGAPHDVASAGAAFAGTAARCAAAAGPGFRSPETATTVAVLVATVGPRLNPGHAVSSFPASVSNPPWPASKLAHAQRPGARRNSDPWSRDAVRPWPGPCPRSRTTVVNALVHHAQGGLLLTQRRVMRLTDDVPEPDEPILSEGNTSLTVQHTSPQECRKLWASCKD